MWHIATFLLFLGLVSCSTALASSLFPGDEQFVRIDYKGARARYDSVLRATPRSPDALWRLARVHVVMGDVAKGDQRRDLYRGAEQYARECIVADSMKAEGHTWLAAALGNRAMYEGSKMKVRLSQEIKRELDRAIRLNPEDDIAYSILGSFYRALGGVSWIERQLAYLLYGDLPKGGYEESEVALKRAIGLAPKVMRHRYELGLLYAQWDRPEEAKEAFTRSLETPVVLASDRHMVQRANEWLGKLE